MKQNETKLQSWSNFNKKLRERNRNEMKQNSKAGAISTKSWESKTKQNENPKLEQFQQKAEKAKRNEMPKLEQFQQKAEREKLK